MVTTDDRLDNAFAAITANNQNLQLLQKEVKEIVESEKQNLERLRLFTHGYQEFSRLEIFLKEFESAVVSLKQGQLVPELLPISAISKAINDIRQVLQTKHLQFRLLHSDPGMYYGKGGFLAARHGTSLYIQVRFYLQDQMIAPLNGFVLKVIPLPFHDSSMHATILSSWPDYFIISRDLKFYTPMTSTEWQNCKQVDTNQQVHCNFIPPLLLSSVPDCILGLLLNDKDMVSQTCTFSVVPNPGRPLILQFEDSKLVISNVTSVELECTDSYRTLSGCKSVCLIAVPCFCQLRLEQYKISPRINHCVNQSQNITKLYPPNLKILEAFFEKSIHKTILPDSLYFNSPKLPVPELEMFNHTFSKLVAQDQTYKLNLEKVIKAVKNEKPVYQNLAEPILDDLTTDYDNSGWNIFSVKYIALGLTVLNTVAIVYLIYKVRTLMLVILALKNTASAQKLFPTFNPAGQLSSTLASDTASSTDSDDHIRLFLYIICFMTCINMILLLWSLRKAFLKSQIMSVLMIEISTENDDIRLPLTSIRSGITDWHLQANCLVKSFSITGNWITGKSLHINYGDFKLTHKFTPRTLPLPENIKLTFWQAKELETVLKQTFEVAIMFQSPCHVMYPNICPVDCKCVQTIENSDQKLYPELPNA